MKTKLVPERIPGELLKLSEVEVKQCYQRKESVFGSVTKSVCAAQKQEVYFHFIGIYCTTLR